MGIIRMKLIFDTDIGTDTDDAFALVYAIRSGIEIPLITTVHGDTKLRGRVAKKLTELLGVDIPIRAGEEKAIKQPFKYWYGDEGHGFLNGENYDVKDNAVDAIAETIYSNRNNIAIASLAPLTNIAKAFQRYPDLPNYVNRIYLMGNAIMRENEYFINYRAHNFKVDPEAVDIVIATAIPKTIVTTEIARRNSITYDDIDKIEKTGKVGKSLADAARFWMKKVNYTVSHMYDPLTVAHHLDMDLTERKDYKDETSITTGMKKPFIPGFLEKIIG